MAELYREFDIWGTVIVYKAQSDSLALDDLEAAAREVEDFFIHVDETFSTYKENSVVSQLRRGEIDIKECSDEVRGVWNACAFSRDLTHGYFDPWCVEGGFDPSGYVKGWAADRAAEIFSQHGITECVINAGGDVTVRSATPSKLAIRSPYDRSEVIHSIDMSHGAMATSGTTEKGAHIRDPHTGLIAIGALTASVWGPDGGIAEALATALIVSGKDGANLFSQPELRDYHCFVIDRGDDHSWSV